jgi:hypothetical protein
MFLFFYFGEGASMLIKFSRLTTVILIFSFISYLYPMNKAIFKQGFVEVENKSLLKDDYENLYKKFDIFIDKMSNHKDFSEKIYYAEKEYSKNITETKRYCNAPPSYRDPLVHPTKRFNKIYCQYTLGHHEFLKKDKDLPGEASDFYDCMREVDTAAKAYFVEILQHLENEKPGIRPLLYGNYKELTVISKIVRYKKNQAHKWGTTPHFDKSALSLILDSNDKNHESLLLCEDVENPSIEALHKPERQFAHKNDATSAILIPGLAFKKAKWDINPTLHGVTTFDKEYRHAIISFLLIPDIDMTNLQTDFEIN